MLLFHPGHEVSKQSAHAMQIYFNYPTKYINLCKLFTPSNKYAKIMPNCAHYQTNLCRLCALSNNYV